MFDIDYVMPYVNMNDPVWQQRKKAFTATHKKGTEQDRPVRYTDYGFFRYVFRAIATNLPWIRTLHLIVESPSQVPDWLNTENVHIVYHSDIMPKSILPTYNSSTIEMFIDKIPDLAEHFLYANDDMLVLNPLLPEDWFSNETTLKMNVTEHTLSMNPNYFYQMVSKEWWELAALCGQRRKYTTRDYCKPSHDIAPMLLTDVKKCRELMDRFITPHLEPFRNQFQHNQYIYIDYSFLKGHVAESERRFSYFSPRHRPRDVAQVLRLGVNDTVVLNDAEGPYRFEWVENVDILTTLSEMFPTPCKYEKQ